jgi:hypothetical protein
MLHACSYTICFVFCYTLWCFYVFSGTNLLTRCHSASSLFSAVFMFQKSYIGNIIGIRRNKSRTSFFTRASRRPPGPPTDDAPSPIKSPRREKPKRRITFPRNILQAATITVARLGGSRSSSRYPAEEGNPCRRPSTPPWSPPE